MDLIKESGSVSENVECEGSVSSPPDSASPKHQFQEAAEEEQVSGENSPSVTDTDMVIEHG